MSLTPVCGVDTILDCCHSNSSGRQDGGLWLSECDAVVAKHKMVALKQLLDLNIKRKKKANICTIYVRTYIHIKTGHKSTMSKACT